MPKLQQYIAQRNPVGGVITIASAYDIKCKSRSLCWPMPMLHMISAVCGVLCALLPNMEISPAGTSQGLVTVTGTIPS